MAKTPSDSRGRPEEVFTDSKEILTKHWVLRLKNGKPSGIQRRSVTK